MTPRARKPTDADRIAPIGTGKIDVDRKPAPPRPTRSAPEAADRGSAELDEIRARLLRERDEAAATLREMGVTAEREPAGPRAAAEAVLDVGDAAQASERRDLSATARERLANRINRLTAALERIEEGTYGRCSTCGEEIGAARLAAIPEADTCLACQEERERAAGRG